MPQAPRKLSDRRKKIKAAIEHYVISTLGRPPRFIKIDAINVFDNNWRVNVWAKVRFDKKESLDNGIPHSFFITTDFKGNIIECDPPVRRTYRATHSAQATPPQEKAYLSPV